MTAEEIKKIVNKLNLPQKGYVLFGGSTLALAGIRNAKDIDLFVSNKLYKRLIKEGWKSYSGDIPHLSRRIGDYEIQAFSSWKVEGWKPKITNYLKNPEFISGLPCMPIKDLYEWKEYTRRGKDLRDLELIKLAGQR